MKFVIIAGNEGVSQRLSRWLKAGYPDCQPLVATGGRGTLETLQGAEVAAVVVADRRDVIASCRVVRSLSYAPLVALGNAHNGEKVQQAIEAGCDCYLDKTISRVVFLAHIEALLRRIPGDIDPVTDVLSMRSFRWVLDREMERSRRYGRPFCLALINIGVPQGPQDGALMVNGVLRDVAHILKASIRSSDILARSGPGQFFIVMPESDAEAAIVLIGRLKPSLNAWSANQGLLAQGVKVEYGWSAWRPGDQVDQATLMRLARESLSEGQRLKSEYEKNRDTRHNNQTIANHQVANNQTFGL